MDNIVFELNDVSRWMVDLLVRASIYGGIVILIVLPICYWVRLLPAHAKCWLLRLVLLKMFIAAVWLTPIEVPVLPAIEAQKTVEVTPIEMVSAITAPHVESTKIAIQNHFPVRENFTIESKPASAFEVVPERATFHYTSWLMISWLVGTLFFSYRLLRQFVHSRSLFRYVKTVDANSTSILKRLCNVMDVAQPSLQIIEKPIAPCIVGIFRPTIFIPHGLTKLKTSKRFVRCSLMNLLICSGGTYGGIVYRRSLKSASFFIHSFGSSIESGSFKPKSPLTSWPFRGPDYRRPNTEKHLSPLSRPIRKKSHEVLVLR